MRLSFRFAVALPMLGVLVPSAAQADQPLGCTGEAQAYAAAPSMAAYGALANCMRLNVVTITTTASGLGGAFKALPGTDPPVFNISPKPGPVSPQLQKKIDEMVLQLQEMKQ